MSGLGVWLFGMGHLLSKCFLVFSFLHLIYQIAEARHILSVGIPIMKKTRAINPCFVIISPFHHFNRNVLTRWLNYVLQNQKNWIAHISMEAVSLPIQHLSYNLDLASLH